MPLSTVEAHRQRFDIYHIELPAAIAELNTYFVTAKIDTWTPALAHFIDALEHAEK